MGRKDGKINLTISEFFRNFAYLFVGVIGGNRLLYVTQNYDIMKKLILLACALFLMLPVMAQDMLIMRNGDRMYATVVQMTKKKVVFQRWGFPEEPLRWVKTKQLMAIHFQNGDMVRLNGPKMDDRDRYDDKHRKQHRPSGYPMKRPFYDGHWKEEDEWEYRKAMKEYNEDMREAMEEYYERIEECDELREEAEEAREEWKEKMEDRFEDWDD